ncbi:MAG TPA: S46 family peptidase, partial [Flavobacteriales bacterium]|nr:S46 family peptidase [Flavobacteriales bacterium]
MKRTLIVWSLLLVSLTLRADEGMWLLMHLKKMNMEDMQKKGLRLTAEEIYDINKPGLKDAVVSLGGFCTAEVISKEGLLLTNHHCAFDAIQTFSTVENDYLTNGFWAMDRKQELNVPGLFVNFLVRMEDVTEKVLAAGANMGVTARNEAMRRKMEELRKEATKGTHYTAEI